VKVCDDTAAAGWAEEIPDCDIEECSCQARWIPSPCRWAEDEGWHSIEGKGDARLTGPGERGICLPLGGSASPFMPWIPKRYTLYVLPNAWACGCTGCTSSYRYAEDGLWHSMEDRAGTSRMVTSPG